MITNDQIVTLAALMNDDDQFATFEREIAQLDTPNIMLVRFVSKLLEGKQYSVMSNNPETISRHLALAEHVGATIERRERSDGFTQIIYSPPLRQ